MNILVVEDEIIVAMDIKELIESMGFKVQAIVTNYDEAVLILEEHNIDMVLMDINLEKSKYDGIDIASMIDKPVIYITAFCDDKTLQRAVQTKPLGYIVKPFNVRDLKANLELAKYKLQMIDYVSSSKMQLGEGYFFDNELDQLFFKEILINLGKYEKKLLKLLLNFNGNIVPFSTIEEEVWEEDFVNESTRRSLIFRLKCKLEHKFIETINGVGCKINILI